MSVETLKRIISLQEQTERIENKLESISGLTLNRYQELAEETAIYPLPIIYPALGLAGEAGEVADKVKKVLRDHNSAFTQEIKREIAMEVGDVLWYCAAIARDLGYALEDIGMMNYEKLKPRQRRGAISGSGDNR